MTEIYEHEKLILPCRHREFSFYAHVEVLFGEQCFLIQKTTPTFDIDLPLKVPFSALVNTDKADRAEVADMICASISEHFADYRLQD